MTRVLVDVTGVWQRDYGVALGHVRVASPRALQTLRAPDWKLKGRCSTDATDVWFDDPRSLGGRRARQLCLRCPVQAICLGSALLFGEEYGIWGGLDPDQRQELDVELRAGMALESVVMSALRSGRERLDEAV